MLRATSGQFVFFDLVSAISGNAVTGASGQISGRKATDAISGMIVLSGNIIELGGGAYRANLYDFDTSGLYVGFLFTSSGCVPRSFSVVTTDASSGRQFPASGINTVVPPASLSGTVVNSGLFVSLPIATISGVVANSGLTVTVVKDLLSGVVANSGLFVNVPIASISGTVVNSGLNVIVPIATISGVVANSGLNTNANVVRWLTVAPNALVSSGRVDAVFNVNTNVARSGTANTIQLDTGVPTGISGVYDNQIITIVAGTGAGRSRAIQNMGSSGIAFVFPNWDSSGVPDTTSVFTITPGAATFSGQVFPASGVNAVVPPSSLSGVIANSGLFVSVPIATISGVVANSGLNATVPIASISGVTANSGLFVSVPIATLSGVIANSGLFVTATTASGSLYLASGSIFRATFASGVIGSSGGFPQAWGDSGMIQAASGTTYIASGPFVNVLIATISGVVANSGLTVTVIKDLLSGVVANSGLNVVATATVASGSLYLASGSIFRATYASGVIGASGGFITAWGDSGMVQAASGTTYIASGPFAVVPPVTLSGVVANSGLTVTVPTAGISGVFGTASLNSGQLVNVFSGQLSGFQVTARTVSDKSGYVLAQGGADTVVVESGMNLRQAMAIIAASAAGRLSGAGTTTVLIDGANVSGTNRISATVNASGDRTAVVLSLPL